MTEASLWSVRDQQALTATFSIQKKVSQMNWMNLLAGAIGAHQHPEYHDFVNRYDKGRPWNGYSDSEVMSRYQQVAPHLPPEAYHDVAREAFDRLTPEEREQFAQWLHERTQQAGVPVQGFAGASPSSQWQNPAWQTPAFLAQTRVC